MRRLLEVYGLLLIVALACWPSVLALHQLWIDPHTRGNSHGYLVAFLALALIFHARRKLAAADLGRAEQSAREFRRAELAAAGQAESPFVPLQGVRFGALGVLLLLSVLWVVFWLAGIQDAHLALLPLIAAAAVYALFGFPTLRVLAFPLAFLYFAEPLWEALNAPLQALTVAAQRVLLAWADVPARIDGFVIRLPNGAFEVESGCSGLHFLVVGLAIAALYGELCADTAPRRALWLAIMAVLAVSANWLRVFTVVLAGYQTNMRHYLVSVDHYRFGWALFVLALLLFLFLASRLAPRRKALAAGDAAHGTGVRSEIARPAIAQIVVSVGAARWLIVTLCVLAFPALAYVKAASAEPVAVVSIDWPNIAAPWLAEAASGAGSPWQPSFLNATASEMRRFRAPDGESIELFTVMYQRQRQNAEVVSYANSLLGAPEALRPVSETLIRDRAGDWRETRAADAAGRDSLVHWRYLVGNSVFVHAMASQVWYGVAALRRAPAAALVALRADCTPNCAAARQRLEAFAAANCSSPGCGAIVRSGPVPPTSAASVVQSTKSAAEAPRRAVQ